MSVMQSSSPSGSWPLLFALAWLLAVELGAVAVSLCPCSARFDWNRRVISERAHATEPEASTFG